VSERIFYAAISSDGYLAGPNGDMSWAEKYLSSGEDYGYFNLVSTSAAILQGRATFDFEIESGVQGPRPLPTYVLTHIPELYENVVQENIYFTGGEIERVVELIEENHPGRLFIMGGADVVRQLLDAGLIDTMSLFVCLHSKMIPSTRSSNSKMRSSTNQESLKRFINSSRKEKALVFGRGLFLFNL
jgi:dihydrofolate reductase